MRVSELIREAAPPVTGLPPWYTGGRLLTAADLDRLDASEFLEGDEFDYEWRLCRVPVGLLVPHIAASWDEAIAGFIQVAGGTPAAAEYEHERIDSLKQWFEQDGVEQCFETTPIVALLTSDGSVRILDGFHRISVAVHLCHATHVLAAVGLGDPVE